MGTYQEKEYLIMQYNDKLQDWTDVTNQVQWFEERDTCCRIKYNSSDTFYNKSYRTISIYKNPNKIDFTNNLLCHKGNILNSLTCLLKFGDWYKAFFENGTTSIYHKDNLYFTKVITEQKEVKSILDYLAGIAQLLSVGDGKDFLYNQIKNIAVIENSFIDKFIYGKLKRGKESASLIFPFSTNQSQKQAVKNAMEFDLSLIQGPPGTGKTQTILNIVANCIVNGQTVAVLSGNNEATKNVEEKLSYEGFGAINAVLGKKENVNRFFKDVIFNNKTANKIDTKQLCFETSTYERKINTALQYDLDIAKLKQLIDEFQIEKRINDAEYSVKTHQVPNNIQELNFTSKKLLELTGILETLPDKKISEFFSRVRLLFRYGLLKVKDIALNKDDTVEFLKNKYYIKKIDELNVEKSIKTTFVKQNNYAEITSKFYDLSRQLLKTYVNNYLFKHGDDTFDEKTYRYQFNNFTKRFPVIYSTTHAIASCSGKQFLYDCVIIDESSQVDLVTAFIAFSVAKRVVLVGDNMQITNVIESKLIPQLKELYQQSCLPEYYDFRNNNILQCVEKRFENIPKTLLNEHYRCDPQIIGFCNKRFYNNQLVIQTKHNEGNGITIVKHGSHFARGRTNERQVDIIEKDIIPTFYTNNIGIIAPYNDQVTLLRERFESYGYTVDTVHKFQGREKDTIVLSTVSNKVQFFEEEDKIDFINNPNLINVAISRAKSKLYILASEEILNQENAILRDMSKYEEYFCSATKIVNTSVFSVFDLMYDDYAPILKDLGNRLLHISEHKSENIIATIIADICNDEKIGGIGYKHNFPLKYVVKSSCSESEEDAKFLNNINTHCDFMIYSLIDKSINLVVEVDGSQHKEEVQAARDRRKDKLLERAGVKVLRLTTLSIDCKEKIVEALKI